MVKNKTIRRNRRKSARSNRSNSSNKKSSIVHMFIEMLNVVKLYHWKTKSYAQHKATDELYELLNGHIDKFVEVMLGKNGSRIEMWEKDVLSIQYTNLSDFKGRVYEYRTFLSQLNNYFDATTDSDLLNIRDEILGDLNQFLYLLTFK